MVSARCVLLGFVFEARRQRGQRGWIAPGACVHGRALGRVVDTICPKCEQPSALATGQLHGATGARGACRGVSEVMDEEPDEFIDPVDSQLRIHGCSCASSQFGVDAVHGRLQRHPAIPETNRSIGREPGERLLHRSTLGQLFQQRISLLDEPCAQLGLLPSRGTPLFVEWCVAESHTQGLVLVHLADVPQQVPSRPSRTRGAPRRRDRVVPPSATHCCRPGSVRDTGVNPSRRFCRMLPATVTSASTVDPSWLQLQALMNTPGNQQQ